MVNYVQMQLAGSGPATLANRPQPMDVGYVGKDNKSKGKSKGKTMSKDKNFWQSVHHGKPGDNMPKGKEKGSEKPAKTTGDCHNRGQPGLYVRECWSKRGRSVNHVSGAPPAGGSATSGEFGEISSISGRRLGSL